MTLFDSYKPFRNRFRNLELFDTLHTIWIKSNFSQFNKPLPINFRIIRKQQPGFTPGKQEIMLYNGLDHELEIMLIEALYSCQIGIRSNSSLKNPQVLKKALRDLRDFDSAFYSSSKAKTTNYIFRSLQRLAYHQFLWQVKMTSHSLFPYFYIYNTPVLKQIIEKEFDLSPKEIIILGLSLTYRSTQQFQLDRIQHTGTPAIPLTRFKKFISEFSIDLKELRQTVYESYKVNEKIFSYLNPLRAKPIISYQDYIYCPMPILIYWAITKGIYYRIYHHTAFSNPFGVAFQNIIGEIVNRAIENKNLQLIPEEEYFAGKARKDTVDWRLKDKKDELFIECKTKRMTRNAKFPITVEDIKNDIEKMAEFLFQTYNTFIDFTNNLYPNNSFDPNIKYRIVILTLEEWFIKFNLDDFHLIEERLKIKLKKTHPDLDLSLISEVPFYLMSMPEFIDDIQIINKTGIHRYFQLLDSNKLDQFKESFTFKDLFKKDFDQFIQPYQ